MRSKCDCNPCCCVKVITKIGSRGPQGPKGAQGIQGPEGPAGPQGPDGPSGGRVLFQSSASITGSLISGDNIFTNIGANLFTTGTNQYLLWLDLNITSSTTHTVTIYFKKNGVLFGPTRKRILQTFDQFNFKTGIFSFAPSDTIDLVINTTSSTAAISEVLVHSIRQI